MIFADNIVRTRPLTFFEKNLVDSTFMFLYAGWVGGGGAFFYWHVLFWHPVAAHTLDDYGNTRGGGHHLGRG